MLKIVFATYYHRFRNQKAENADSHFLTGWEGIGLHGLTFKTMTQNNFCSVISPFELNTGSIPFLIKMLVLRVRYLRFGFNTCAQCKRSEEVLAESGGH